MEASEALRDGDTRDDEEVYRESVNRARAYLNELQVRDDASPGELAPDGKPIGMRSLQWIRRNMSSLRIIVSLQRVTPQDPEERPRRASGL